MSAIPSETWESQKSGECPHGTTIFRVPKYTSCQGIDLFGDLMQSPSHLNFRVRLALGIRWKVWVKQSSLSIVVNPKECYSTEHEFVSAFAARRNMRFDLSLSIRLSLWALATWCTSRRDQLGILGLSKFALSVLIGSPWRTPCRMASKTRCAHRKIPRDWSGR